ncbi:MAG: aminotransferase class I/II-fold pyridoxal phosphate-dependent enzyme [Planctomycetaceae bacterium]|nr:aminotransferase class I/II-fold pyridoxal phosphate-dependent enzyme [Planctomycetaceae bacterium]
MIPRRRLPICSADLWQGFNTLLHSDPRQDRQDVAAFEAAFGDYLGCAFARATSSGRDAMALALQAVGLRPGDEIIIPAYTLGELIKDLQSKGYRPVAADVEPDTFNVDVRSIASHIGPQTRAILALHLHGAPCDISAVCDLARRHHLRVVEDCAHALGASVGGRRVGTFGDASFFSLETNKALPTYGGGIVVVRDPLAGECVDSILAQRRVSRWPVLAKMASCWRDEALVRSPFYGLLARVLFAPAVAGAFERLYRRSHTRRRRAVAYSGLQARLGLSRLATLDERNRRLNERWTAMQTQLPDGFVAQKRDRVGQPAFYNFTALSTRLAPRDLRRALFRRGIDIGIGREVMDDCGRILGATDCPVATDIFERAVILPLYEGLSAKHFARTVGALKEAVVVPL